MDIKKIQEMIDNFADERDWKQFHTPKNLVMALSVESSELLEIFQWLTPEESFALKNDLAKKELVADEIADILVYLLRLSHQLDINVEEALKSKMKKNADKYPVEKSRGNSKKYSEF